MASLFNQTQNNVVVADLRQARNFVARAKGLLGTKSLAAQEALWIHRCNSIHTFFMKYPIDCVFLDKEMKVKSLRKDIRPGRFVLPQWGAVSVIEMQSGGIERTGLRLGDQLNVGT